LPDEFRGRWKLGWVYIRTGSFIQNFNEYVKIYWLQIQVSIPGNKYNSTQKSIPSSFDFIQFQDILIQVIYSIPSSFELIQFQDISIQVIYSIPSSVSSYNSSLQALNSKIFKSKL